MPERTHSSQMDAQGKAVMSIQETDGTGYANVENESGTRRAEYAMEAKYKTIVCFETTLKADGGVDDSTLHAQNAGKTRNPP